MKVDKILVSIIPIKLKVVGLSVSGQGNIRDIIDYLARLIKKLIKYKHLNKNEVLDLLINEAMFDNHLIDLAWQRFEELYA